MTTSQNPEQLVPTFTVGDRLGKALRHANVSTQEMADYLDVHRNTISAYVNDRQPVKGGTLRLWAMRTGVPMEWLESGDAASDTPTPPPSGRRDNSALAALIAEKSARGSTARYFQSEPEFDTAA